jgi:asparagine synthase (glutamine-hydrolysing)
MCGICGVIEYHRPIDRDVLMRMNNAMWHRGPDDGNFYVEDANGRGASVGLGMRRLAIIDLSGGRQPMCNEDESIWIVFNGEIYNFLDLRPELEARGHVFRTNSDTEAIVHLYEDYGPDCVQHLNGMFAFAIWDSKKQTLFIARDRMGKKPMYYIDTGEQFLFASEVKVLLQHPNCPRELDAEALSKYLAYEYVPSPRCIFKGIYKLPAAHSLTWKDGRVSVRRYWDLSFSENNPIKSEDEYADELRARLKEAVRLRLISDVPLGVFLSGGIDSSSVVAMMSEIVPPSQIKTFSIGFEDKSFDESTYARTVANFYGTDHREQILKPQTMLDILPQVGSFMDEPFADASIIPTYLLSKFTREYVTVALGGDGGDELFAGYPTFVAHRMAQFYKVPRFVHERVIAPMAARLPVNTSNISFDFKVKQFLRGMTYRPEIRNQVWLGAFTPTEQRELLNGAAVATDPYEDIDAAEQNCDSRDLLERMIYLYCKFYLQDDILVKVDRASMACSLEARAPMLDYTFVEFVNTIPVHLKLNGLKTKYILKKAMRDKLPPDIATRGKKGFGIPVAKWFKTDLKELVLDTFAESRIQQQGIFHAPTIARLLDEHFRGVKDNRKPLWTLFMFQMWHENYLKQPQAVGRS